MSDSLDLIGQSIIDRARVLFMEIVGLEEEQKISVLNALRLELHECSPFREEPVDCVLWVKADSVQANTYNPNRVAPPEMRLLELSIKADGYTQPIVVYPDGTDEQPHHEVVDGFHRNRVGKESKAVRQRVKGYLPVTIIRDDRREYGDRVAATIRHNRARGKHQVQAMSELVRDLARRNHSDAWIARELGMEPDEVLRLKQISGLAELFANREFSEAWEVVEAGDEVGKAFGNGEGNS